MLRVIADEQAIKKYTRQFVKKMKAFADEPVKAKLGHQGASFPAKVLWSKKLGIWSFSQAIKDVRYWNAFGVGRPQEASHLPITAEINFPWTGIDRKTGAAFAVDARNNVCVVHRGKIGGGKKGIGKALFDQKYRGVWSFMEDGDCLSQVAVIGVLNSSRFTLQIAQFVKKIEKLKSSAAVSTQTSLNFSEIVFREDLIGRAPCADDQEISALCDHGLVVSQLAALLTRWKLKIGNDSAHDLFLMDSFTGKMSHVFEISADNSERSVLAATAKLLLLRSGEVGNPMAVLVLPEDEIDTYAQQLQRLNVFVLGFRLEEERIAFPDLGKIQLDQNWQL